LTPLGYEVLRGVRFANWSRRSASRIPNYFGFGGGFVGGRLLINQSFSRFNPLHSAMIGVVLYLFIAA
jgi:hypothetical protein